MTAALSNLPAPAMVAALLTLLGGGVFLALLYCTLILQFRARRLFSALRSAAPETFNHLTTICGFGPGMNNPVRLYRFLESPDQDSDPEIGPLKSVCRTWMRRWLRFVVIFGVVWALIAVGAGILLATNPR
jgi:hypothetical protein